jgi:hypothetical protein
MSVMSLVRLCLVVALGFAASSLQQSKNPLNNDFCRRWGHQTAQVDGKLFIDGGLVASNPLTANAHNETSLCTRYVRTERPANMHMNRYMATVQRSQLLDPGRGHADAIREPHEKQHGTKCFWRYIVGG